MKAMMMITMRMIAIVITMMSGSSQILFVMNVMMIMIITIVMITIVAMIMIVIIMISIPGLVSASLTQGNLRPCSE
jgi:hypothetical protein